MKIARSAKVALSVAAATFALSAFATSGFCQDSDTNSSTSAPAVQQASLGPDAATPSSTDTKHTTIREKIKKIVDQIPGRIEMDREFKIASAVFPSFCQHWQQDLRDRETNNRNHLNFVEKDGYETATYTGYGKIEECESHQSKMGFSIGRITYEEFEYYIVGKTQTDAVHAAPKPVSDTHTTELFRWDNNKWFY
jgi:hypothetical protein